MNTFPNSCFACGSNSVLKVRFSGKFFRMFRLWRPHFPGSSFCSAPWWRIESIFRGPSVCWIILFSYFQLSFRTLLCTLARRNDWCIFCFFCATMVPIRFVMRIILRPSLFYSKSNHWFPWDAKLQILARDLEFSCCWIFTKANLYYRKMLFIQFYSFLGTVGDISARYCQSTADLNQLVRFYLMPQNLILRTF